MNFCNSTVFTLGIVFLFCNIPMSLVLGAGQEETIIRVFDKGSGSDIVSAIVQGCPLMARQAIDDFKQGSVKNNDQLIPYFEERYCESFEPLKGFLIEPSNHALFYKAYECAKINRDYDIAKAILNKMPETYVKGKHPKIKEILMESLIIDEKTEVGSVLFSNRIIKVFTTFPNVANSFTNPPGTFRVEWEEHLDYKNKLHFSAVPSGRRVQSLENLADAKVLWSASGRYLAVQWRSFLRVRESEVLKNTKSIFVDPKDPYISLPSKKYQISIIDTLQPEKILHLEGYLPEKARQSARIDYWIREWKDDDTVSICASWDEGAELVNERFHVTLDAGENLKVRITK